MIEILSHLLADAEARPGNKDKYYILYKGNNVTSVCVRMHVYCVCVCVYVQCVCVFIVPLCFSGCVLVVIV